MPPSKFCKILGTQFGIKLEPRGPTDNHICFTILSEDDETWFEKDVSGSTYWLDDLIGVLQDAKTELEQNPHLYTRNQWGYNFKG